MLNILYNFIIFIYKFFKFRILFDKIIIFINFFNIFIILLFNFNIINTHPINGKIKIMIYYRIGDQDKKSLYYYGNSGIGDYLSKFFEVVSSISHDLNGLSIL